MSGGGLCTESLKCGELGFLGFGENGLSGACMTKPMNLHPEVLGDSSGLEPPNPATHFSIPAAFDYKVQQLHASLSVPSVPFPPSLSLPYPVALTGYDRLLLYDFCKQRRMGV